LQIYTWDKAGYSNAYSRYYYKLKGCGARHRRTCICTDSSITYCRTFFEDNLFFKDRAQNIVVKLNIIPGKKVFVVGCGFGFLMEELGKMGVKVWGCDNSQYIQSNKNKPSEKSDYDIFNISALDNNFANDVKKVSGITSFDYVITEDVLTSHNEYTTILNNCESLLTPGLPSSNVIHLVDLTTNTPFIRKTYTEWKNINPNHTWLDAFGKTPQ